MELGQFSEFPVQFLDDDLSLNQILVFDLTEWLSPRGGDQLFLLVVLHSHHIHLGLEISLRISLNPVGRISQDPIVLIRANE